MQAITLRPLSKDDSLDELTAMLHRAFFRLGQMDLNCTCVDQSVELTRERIARGECYVADCDGRVVGTITLYHPDPRSESVWYHRGAVASAHQFGVHPEFQGKGLGTALLEFAEGWAQLHGYQELALDTAQPARHLLAFYMGHGYRIVESVRFPGKHYWSVVLSKVVADSDISCAVASHLLHATATRVGTLGGRVFPPSRGVPRDVRHGNRRDSCAPIVRRARLLTHPLRPRCLPSFDDNPLGGARLIAHLFDNIAVCSSCRRM